MKKSNLIGSLAAVAAAALLATSARAADGTITVTGRVTASTCTYAWTGTGVTGGNNTPNPTITLASIYASSIPNVGSTTGNVNATLNYTGCDSASSTVNAWFDSSSGGGFTNGRIPAVPGIDIQVLNGLTVMVLSSVGAGSQTGMPPASITSNAASQAYTFRYYRAATAVTLGSFTTTVTYTVQYT